MDINSENFTPDEMAHFTSTDDRQLISNILKNAAKNFLTTTTEKVHNTTTAPNNDDYSDFTDLKFLQVCNVCIVF